MTSIGRLHCAFLAALLALVASGCAISLAPIDPDAGFDAGPLDAVADVPREIAPDVAVDTGASVPEAAPRPIAPLSTATVTSRRPMLHWQLAPGTDGARVEICRDRGCAAIIASFDATGSAGAPAADLPPGVVFWRLHGESGSSIGTAVSPTWQFTVGARSAPVDTSWGTVLDVNGDGYADVLVGAASADSAYVYLGSASGLATTPATSLVAPAGGQFGISVASAGDVNGDGYADVVVGALSANNGDGAAYVYLGGAMGLSPAPASVMGLAVSGSFGESVTSAGDVNGDGYADVAVGAYTAANNSGAAYVFLGSASGVSPAPATSLAGDADGSYFGISVASAGDVDGDGYADLVVGAVSGPRGGNGVYVYRGGMGGLSATPALSFGSNGGWVACAGDVNGDGYADVLVPPSSGDAVGSVASLYLGTATGLSATTVYELAADLTEASFWARMVSAADVNGDGFGDLVLGVPDGNSAYVYLGGASGPSVRPTVVVRAPDGGSYGWAAASAGDINGDGYADVVVGAFGANGGAGAAYGYLGSASGLSVTPATSLVGPVPGGNFGWSVASAAVRSGRRSGERAVRGEPEPRAI